MKKGIIKSAAGPVEMSKIVLGTGNFGSTVPESVSFEIMDKYYELGGRAFDTARFYMTPNPDGASKSERTVGRWLRKTGLRDEVVIVTKGCHPEFKSMNVSRLDRMSIEYDLNTSLAVLDIDRADMYALHRDDENIPVGEIMDVLHEKVDMGLIKTLCASNWSVRRIAEANDYAEKNGKTPFCASQIVWNFAGAVNDIPKDSTLSYMTKEDYSEYLRLGLPVMGASVQAGGFYYKYAASAAGGLNGYDKALATPGNIKRAEYLLDVCRKLGCNLVQLSLGFILSGKIDAYAVIGASCVSQLLETVSYADFDVPYETIMDILG